ncbi:MAG: amidohydrolase [Tardiphaga sp.]|nr:amidohydrolase [Tardiphaga sp.]
MPIDAHAHYVPPSLIETIAGRASDFGLSVIPHPTSCSCALHFNYGLKVRPFFPKLIEPIAERRDAMAKQGIDRQILSMWADIFGPGLPRATAVKWHRYMNENMAALCEKNPDSFSMLASVPLPHADEAASELHRAVGQLGAIGAVIPANVDGVNLGELNLDAFWQAAVDLDVGVFIHPVQAQPHPRSAKFALSQIAQYTVDTTFTVGSLISGGVMDRFPALRIMLSHGGGTFPYLTGRFDVMHQRMNRAEQGDVAQADPSSYLQRFYYDTIVHDPVILRWLTDRVSADRVVLGSDYSFPPADHDPIQTARRAGLSADELLAISERNPRRLFPRLPPLG